MFDALFIGISFIYAILFIAFGIVLLQHQPFVPNAKKLPDLTVLIAFRNEAMHLPNLLQDLDQQNYPSSNITILLINDHSSDAGELIVQHHSSSKHIRLLHLPPSSIGKKAAIAYGVAHAQTELLITTDADCRLQANWLLTMGSFYAQYQPALIVAPVAIVGSGLFASMQAVEMMSLMATTAATAIAKHAIMNNAANMAFERSAYVQHQSKLQHQYHSGDDIFLLFAIKNESPERIRYLDSQKAIVYTQAQTRFSDFFWQRIRWTSKSSSYTDKDTIAVALLILLWHVLLTTSIVLSFNNSDFSLFFVLFLSKSMVDTFILVLFAMRSKQQKQIRFIIPTIIVYPFYILIIGILGNFLPFRWKNRKGR